MRGGEREREKESERKRNMLKHKINHIHVEIYCVEMYRFIFNVHWLPIRQGIAFKMLLLVYKTLNSQAPNYLSELISIKSHPYALT